MHLRLTRTQSHGEVMMMMAAISLSNDHVPGTSLSSLCESGQVILAAILPRPMKPCVIWSEAPSDFISWHSSLPVGLSSLATLVWGSLTTSRTFRLQSLNPSWSFCLVRSFPRHLRGSICTSFRPLLKCDCISESFPHHCI